MAALCSVSNGYTTLQCNLRMRRITAAVRCWGDSSVMLWLLLAAAHTHTHIHTPPLLPLSLSAVWAGTVGAASRCGKEGMNDPNGNGHWALGYWAFTQNPDGPSMGILGRGRCVARVVERQTGLLLCRIRRDDKEVSCISCPYWRLLHPVKGLPHPSRSTVTVPWLPYTQSAGDTQYQSLHTHCTLRCVC